MALRAALRYFAPRTTGPSSALRAASTAAAAAPAPPAAEPEVLPSMDEMRTKARRVYKEVRPLHCSHCQADSSCTASAVTSEYRTLWWRLSAWHPHLPAMGRSERSRSTPAPAATSHAPANPAAK